MTPSDVSMRLQGQTCYIKSPSYCGVYFLFRNGTLIYIGMSSNIAARLGAHASGKSRGSLCVESESLVYDEAVCLKCESWDEAKRLEKFYIKEMQPELNISHTKRNLRGLFGSLKRFMIFSRSLLLVLYADKSSLSVFGSPGE